MIHKIKVIPIILLLLFLFILPMNEQNKAQAATLQISNTAFTLSVNHYKTLYITGTSNKVTWTSNNSAIASVSTTGRVTAKSPGTATIYASVSGKKLSCKVTVIKLSTSSTVLTVGTAKTLKVYGTSNTVTWSSGNRTIATVTSSGKITAKSPGKVTIYASVSGKKLSCVVTVIKLNTSSAALAVGTTKTLKVYGASGTVAWTTSNNSIASVTSGGIVTAKSTGTASITAAVLGTKLTSKITVNNSEEPAITPTAPLSKPISNIIGYYAAWSRYSGFTPNKIDANKVTHINYAFANIGSDLKIKLGFPDIDPTNIAGLNQLKQVNPNLKTIISVGGYSWSGRFSDVALTEESRAIFANSCIDFIVKYNFDGVDIDWEYPVTGGLSTNSRRPEDKYNFTLLLKAIREKLDAQGAIDGKQYFLTFAGAAGSWYMKNIEPANISQYVDYANIMTYDIHGTWESYTNFNAPLYSSDPLHPNYISADSSIRGWMNAGFPKDKLVMGVPFYGYIYKAVANLNNGLNQTYSGGASISYKNIAANYLGLSEYINYYHPNSRVPWLFNGTTFITYENEQSIAEKAKYSKENGLGGVMIWELSQDPNKVLLNSLYQELRQ